MPLMHYGAQTDNVPYLKEKSMYFSSEFLEVLKRLVAQDPLAFLVVD